MSQQVFDIDTVGFSMNGINGLGSYFDFYVNNVFSFGWFFMDRPDNAFF